MEAFTVILTVHLFPKDSSILFAQIVVIVYIYVQLTLVEVFTPVMQKNNKATKPQSYSDA